MKSKREQQSKPASNKIIHNKKYLGKYEITFYTNHQASTGKSYGDKGYGITSSGARTQEGVTIACPKNFEYGDRLYIETVGIRTCQDTGSAIKNQKLDVYVKTEAEAYRLGRKKLDVYKIN